MNLAAGQATNSTAFCPAGKKALGGGVLGSDNLALQASSALGDGSGWTVVVRNYGNAIGHLAAFAVCASVS